MYFKKSITAFLLGLSAGAISNSICANTTVPMSNHHFQKVLVVIFENMSYAEIKDEPSFKKLVEYSGNTLTANGHLIKTLALSPKKDDKGNGYAFFSSYYNNHSGGAIPSRSSQPNYFAMTSGSVHDIYDNDHHDLNVDNLAMELNEAQLSWKVYAEDLPDPKPPLAPFPAMREYVDDINLDEQQNDNLRQQYLQRYNHDKLQYENNYFQQGFNNNGCFTGEYFAEKGKGSEEGYARKHEPFISYLNIQNDYNNCKNIMNAAHFKDDLHNLADVSFYIPNLIDDGHNGSLLERVQHANAFLSSMLGTDPTTGEPLPNSSKALFPQFMAQDGLLVITFDEPSVTGNPDKTIYTLLAGNMINSGAYPDSQGNQSPVCYPPVNEQNKYPEDKEGSYDPKNCNHYNLLKLIEANWSLRGLDKAHTSAGYNYAYALDHGIANLWKCAINGKIKGMDCE